MTAPTVRTGRSRVLGGFVWYLAVIFVLCAVVFLGQAISATTSGHDPTLGAHPVRTTATVEDYDVDNCTRGGSCSYTEKVSFTGPGGTAETAKIGNVDTRPEIGGTVTVWYPAGHPSAAQTDGPHGAGYYWLATAGFTPLAALFLTLALRRRRRSRAWPPPVPGVSSTWGPPASSTP